MIRTGQMGRISGSGSGAFARDCDLGCVPECFSDEAGRLVVFGERPEVPPERPADGRAGEVLVAMSTSLAGPPADPGIWPPRTGRHFLHGTGESASVRECRVRPLDIGADAAMTGHGIGVYALRQRTSYSHWLELPLWCT